eukprot:6371989-Amphidinium_carterae.1
MLLATLRSPCEAQRLHKECPVYAPAAKTVAAAHVSATSSRQHGGLQSCRAAAALLAGCLALRAP